MRAVETVISAWIAEQERTAKRDQSSDGFAQSAGTSAPPAEQGLPATSASPNPNTSSPGGTNPRG
jgi:hypothetical protein